MSASLPMYWTAGNAATWETFWNHVQAAAARANMSTVPIIYHGVKLIGGYQELVEYLDANT